MKGSMPVSPEITSRLAEKKRTKEALLNAPTRLVRLRAEKYGLAAQIPSTLGRELDFDPYDDELPPSELNSENTGN